MFLIEMYTLGSYVNEQSKEVDVSLNGLAKDVGDVKLLYEVSGALGISGLKRASRAASS